MRDIDDILQEVSKHGFIQPETPRRRFDIGIGMLQEDSKSKTIYTISRLYQREARNLQKNGAPLWEVHLADVRAKMSEHLFRERVISRFGEEAHRKATENHLTDYSIEVRKNWEVVVVSQDRATRR